MKDAKAVGPSNPKSFNDTHGEEFRRKDQRYSDIFGSPHLIEQNQKLISSPS